MLRPGPLASVNLPRFFWPGILLLAGVAATLVLILPMAKMLSAGATNVNEGWNAYYQRDAMLGKALYVAPVHFVGAVYPPISFHLIGLASRITGNINQTGRWIALLSLLLVAILCGALVRHFTGSAPLAAFTALSVVIWLAVFKEDRIGMNDPQFLGTVFSLLGLYCYIRYPDKLGWLSISALIFTISVFTKHNLVAFPAAVWLHLILGKKWKGLLVWSGVVACGSALLLLLIHRVDGPYFIADLLMPRARSGLQLTHVTEYGILFQVPVALAVAWSLRQRGGSPGMVMVLALISAHVIAAAFCGADGADLNVFFDSILTLIMVGALAFAEFAPLVAGWNPPGLALTALLLAPMFGILIQIPMNLMNSWHRAPLVAERARDFDLTVALLRSRPGPALCETLLACFEAGKPRIYDPFIALTAIKVGYLKESEAVALVENTTFSTVQLEGSQIGPGKRDRFTASFMDALLSHYRVEARLSNAVILVPKE